MYKTFSLLLTLVLSSPVQTYADAMSVQKLPIEAITEINGQTIKLEVAKTVQQREIGLMNRETIPQDQGMLFVFDSPDYVRFWMKNTKIPLDMIFLREGIVKYIWINVPPCYSDPCPTYGPGPSTQIDQVIELKGGEAAKLGLQLATPIVIKYLKSP